MTVRKEPAHENVRADAAGKEDRPTGRGLDDIDHGRSGVRRQGDRGRPVHAEVPCRPAVRQHRMQDSDHVPAPHVGASEHQGPVRELCGEQRRGGACYLGGAHLAGGRGGASCDQVGTFLLSGESSHYACHGQHADEGNRK